MFKLERFNSPVPWGLEEFKIDLRRSRMNWDWLSRNVLQICYINLQFSIFAKNLFWKAFLIQLTSGPHPAVLVLFTFVCCEQTEAPPTSQPLSAHGARLQSKEQLISLSFALLVNLSYWDKNNSFTKRWQPGVGQAPRWVRQDRGLAATGLNSVCCSRGKPRKLWTHAAAVLFFTRKPTVHCFPYYCARNSPHASKPTNTKLCHISNWLRYDYWESKIAYFDFVRQKGSCSTLHNVLFVQYNSPVSKIVLRSEAELVGLSMKPGDPQKLSVSE